MAIDCRVDSADPAPDESHFFVAVCAHRPQVGNPTFVYVPRTANVLRERERHIALLERELGTKNEWLAQAQRDLKALMDKFVAQQEALDRSNRWAQQQARELDETHARVVELQDEMASQQAAAQKMADEYNAKVLELEQDIREKTQWAYDVEAALTAEVKKQTADLVSAVEALHRTEKELNERTAWALALQEAARKLGEQVALVRASRWMRLGRKAGLGPDLPLG